MREIKFRAWDAKRERMLQPFITFEKHSADGLVTETTNWHDDNDMSEGWDVSNQANELMQYTGLKDKNGKEIYEGDIIKGKPYLFNGEFIFGKVIWNNKKGMWQVEEIREYEPDLEYLHEVLQPGHESEIIGNVWGNKDLLK